MLIQQLTNISAQRAIAVFLTAILFSLWIFHSTYAPGYSLTNYGDGLATVGFVTHIMNAFHDLGWSIFLTDNIQLSSFAAGYGEPISLNLFWKIAYIGLGEYLSPDNTYDSIAAIAFIATIISGYWVARYFNMSFGVSILTGILLASIPNFYARIQGHIGLACYFISILQIAFAYRLSKYLDFKSSILYGVTCALAFTQNEYFGYFGIIFTSVYVLTSRFLLFSQGFRKDIPLLVKQAIISLIFFIGSMALLYPNLIGARFLSFLGAPPPITHATPRNYSAYDLNAFSAPNPFGLFSPGVPGLESIGNLFAQGNPGEFTFRIGLVIPAIILFLLIWSAKYQPAEKFRQISRYCIALLIPCILMAMLALPLTSYFSLGWVTLKFASLFRVGARAYLFIDIAVLLVLGILVSEYLKSLSRSNFLRHKLRIILFLALYLAYVDLTGSWLPKQVNALALPSASEELIVLKNEAPGKLIELPFFTSASVPEAGYIYSYNYSIHHKPVANGVYYYLPQQDPELDQLLTKAASRINAPTTSDIVQLGKAGVRYIVINKGAPGISFDRSRLSHLKTIQETEHYEIYEITSYQSNGDFIGDFVLGNSVRLKWGNCGRNYEKEGQIRRFCALPFSLEILNYSSKPLSGKLACRFELNKPAQIKLITKNQPIGISSENNYITQEIDIAPHKNFVTHIISPTGSGIGASIFVNECNIRSEKSL